MLTLTADAAYGHAGKQFVARITGRDPKFTFRREFIGRGGKRGDVTTADVDEAGLYETRDVDGKGRVTDSYCVLLEADGALRQSTWLDKDLAMQIARLLDQGRGIEDVVVLTAGPSLRDPTRTVYRASLATAVPGPVTAAVQAVAGAVGMPARVAADALEDAGQDAAARAVRRGAALADIRRLMAEHGITVGDLS